MMRSDQPHVKRQASRFSSTMPATTIKTRPPFLARSWLDLLHLLPRPRRSRSCPCQTPAPPSPWPAPRGLSSGRPSTAYDRTSSAQPAASSDVVPSRAARYVDHPLNHRRLLVGLRQTLNPAMSPRTRRRGRRNGRRGGLVEPPGRNAAGQRRRRRDGRSRGRGGREPRRPAPTLWLAGQPPPAATAGLAAWQARRGP